MARGDPLTAQEPGVSAVAHVIQLAVAPVFLLSGVGAMLSVLTNRLGRIIDRARALEDLYPSAGAERRPQMELDLRTLARRARLINQAISLCTTCALLVCAVIAALFTGAFLQADLSALVGLMFMALGIENIALSTLDVPARWVWALFGGLFLMSDIV